MGHKVINGVDYYYIHWKGYPAEDDTWKPVTNLTNETLKMWEDSIKIRQTILNSQ